VCVFALFLALPVLALSASAEDAPTIGGIAMSESQERAFRDFVAREAVQPLPGALSVGAMVPIAVELHLLPPAITTDLPAVRTYRYVLTDAGIAIVDSDNRKVVRIFETR
jgi:hypothetical protein